ncbi:MAG: PilZ domain-containing protein [Treponema sp.]|jgi:hypothetical protein|nr:PilZ domain-containing protein [Treponema sp.]
MGILTSQKINAYYELFKTIDVIYSKEILQVTGLLTRQVSLKCASDSWPCVISSSSFQGAKVLVSIKSGILQKLERANNMVSLKFSFRVADKGDPLSFFVTTKSSGYTPYQGSDDMALFTLQFTQRPPDDLIEIMGRILDAGVNSKKRKDERILISPDSARKLNISKESAILIDNLPRHCILRDISFSGARLIMMGVAKFLVNKEAFLKMDFEEPRESFLLKGILVGAEQVEGRKELISLDLQYDENNVQMGYKIRVNDYLSQIRPDGRGSENIVEKKPAAPPPKPAPAAAKPAAPAPTPTAAPAMPTAKPSATPTAAKPPATEWPSPDDIINESAPPVNKVVDTKPPS